MRQEKEQLNREEKLKERTLKHKSYLLALKYIPHFTALVYIIYTILQFLDIDLILLGYLVTTSITTWSFMLLSSIVFRFCYVHRLPLYYILVNEITNFIDYYVGIPISEIKLLGVHLIFIGLLIFGYTYYYLKYVRFNKTCI